MAIRFICSCGKRLRVEDDKAGKRGKCPACGAITVVPAAVAEIQYNSTMAPPEPPAWQSDLYPLS